MYRSLVLAFSRSESSLPLALDMFQRNLYLSCTGVLHQLSVLVCLPVLYRSINLVTSGTISIRAFSTVPSTTTSQAMSDTDEKNAPYFWSLYIRAVYWRVLSKIAFRISWMFEGGVLQPRFTKSIPSTSLTYPGHIKLYFYVPHDYAWNISTKRYPLIINFHGGGFVIGMPPLIRPDDELTRIIRQCH